MRVLPDSRVNFDRLTNEELTKRYVNRFKELQELRATYQKMLQTQKPEQRGKPPKPHIPRQVRGLKLARGLLREKELEIPDCSWLLDNLSRVVAQGSLGPQSDELELICAITRKVMRQSGKAVDDKGSLRMVALLQESSKGQLIDFVTKRDSKLKRKDPQLNPSLLGARSSPFLFPQYMARQPDLVKPGSLTYILKPDENVGLLSGAGGATRLSAGALKRFSQEQGSRLGFGI